MKPLHFKAIINIIGINPYVLVTPDLVAQIKPNWKKPIPVLVQINGKPDQPWKINMMPIGDGSFYLYLHGSIRKISNTQVGDLIEVKVEFDKKYQSGPGQVPDWFRQALNKNHNTQKNWEKLTISRQKEIIRYLVSLKSQEAKDRNLQKVLAVLSGKPGRFMARSWKDGV